MKTPEILLWLDQQVSRLQQARDLLAVDQQLTKRRGRPKGSSSVRMATSPKKGKGNGTLKKSV